MLIDDDDKKLRNNVLFSNDERETLYKLREFVDERLLGGDLIEEEGKLKFTKTKELDQLVGKTFDTDSLREIFTKTNLRYLYTQGQHAKVNRLFFTDVMKNPVTAAVVEKKGSVTPQLIQTIFNNTFKNEIRKASDWGGTIWQMFLSPSKK